jgi:O-antigen/teichoic acid export membrane protein
MAVEQKQYNALEETSTTIGIGGFFNLEVTDIFHFAAVGFLFVSLFIIAYYLKKKIDWKFWRPKS